MNDKFRDFIFNHKKTLTITSAIIGVIILIIVTIIIIEKLTKTATIEVRFAPTTATATINGKKYTNGTYNIEPGTYTIEVKEDGFTTQTKTFTAEKDKTTPVFLLLDSKNGDSAWWKNASNDDQLFIGSIIDQLLYEKGQDYLNKNQILKSLPITIEYYSSNYSSYTKYVISYKQSTDNSFIITITDYSGGNHEKALDNLRKRGYNPDDYTIEYKDLSNELRPGRSLN